MPTATLAHQKHVALDSNTHWHLQDLHTRDGEAMAEVHFETSGPYKDSPAKKDRVALVHHLVRTREVDA
jgi:hypothetical protein